MDLRDRFFLPPVEDAIELRAFTHGLMPRTVPQMMRHFTEDWRRFGVDAWNHIPNHWRPDSEDKVGWWTLPEYLADEFVAPLLGAPRGTCILQPNVHWTMQCLLSAPRISSSLRRVITSAGAFPSVLHSTQRWSELTGLEVVVVPLADDGFVDEDALLEAVSYDPALVVLSHVGFLSGEKLTDAFLQTLAACTHEQGGLLAVDGYHSVATMPIHVQELDVDLYFGGLLKAGCGASGCTFVYVRPGVDIEPRLTGWLGDAAPFAFAEQPTAHPGPRRRFMGGTAAVAPFYHGMEGARILLEAGLENVRHDSLEKTDYALQRAHSANIRVRSPHAPERRGAMMLLEVPEAAKLVHYLKQRHIYTDSRQNRFLRLAPFVWNTHADLERTFDLLTEAVRTGHYRSIEIQRDAEGPVT